MKSFEDTKGTILLNTWMLAYSDQMNEHCKICVIISLNYRLNSLLPVAPVDGAALVEIPVISHEWWADGIVITTEGKFMIIYHTDILKG